jgi:hypothetical protein
MKSAFFTAGAVLFSFVLAGCAGDVTSESATVSSENALLGQNSYLYFRCNATGWAPSATTRLRSTVDPYVFSLLVDVKQDWMTTGGDNCVFTETDQLNGWGTVQTQYGTVHGTVTVPNGDYLNTNGAGFTVKYPAQGRYKLTVNWMQGTFQIGEPSAAEAWQPCFNDQVTTVAQSPQAPNNLFVGCSNGDIFLTFNGQSAKPSWLKVDSWTNSGGTYDMPGLPVNAIAYSPADIKTAYVSFAGSKQGHKLWKTGTGGANWIELANVPLAEIWSISVNPLDPLKVYIMGPGGVFMSPDAGNTWTSNVTAAPLTVPVANGAKLSTVTVATGNRDLVWAGATNGDIFYTTNATSGQTWVKATHGMPERAVTHLALNTSHSPAWVYATFDGMYNDSLWITSNNGFGWANLHTANLPTTPVALPGIYALYGVSVNPAVANVVYVDGTYGAAASTNSGSTWSWTSAN